MKYILYAVLALVIVCTISICVIKPDMHKNVVVYDSDYTLVTEQEVKTETKDIPIIEAPAKQIQNVKVVENKTQEKDVVDFKKIYANNTQTAKQKNTVTTQTKSPVQKTQVTKNKVTTSSPKKIKQQSNPKITTQVQYKEEKKVTPIQTNVKKEEPVVVAKTEKKQTVQTEPKVLTQQEETIAWNKWRSNIQNQIMKDTRLPDIPNGVIFQFSFTVDKYGRITNVHTGANPSNYTPHAIQYIAPVIRSYQGKPILNFPEGTARTSTNVTGKWRLADVTKYSTPQDFNDIETVRR